MSKSRFVLVIAALGAAVTLGSLAPRADEPAQPVDPGMAAYNKKCAMCHGKNGVALKMGEGSANLNDPEWKKSTNLAEVIKIVTEGKDKMKPLKEKMTAAEIEAASAYALALK